MPYTHLTSRERYVIEQLLLHGCSYREIGRRLCRHHSTIQREFDRNGPGSHAGVYIGERADRLAQQRRCLARHQRRWGDARLRAAVEAGLARDWSPEQIAGRLRRDHPGSARMRISPETIYRWVYRAATAGDTLYSHLRRAHKKRRKQGRGGAGRGLIPGRVSIHERPAAVESRRRFGDWEGDLVEGGKGGGVIATLVERKSRYLLARGLASKQQACRSRRCRSGRSPGRPAASLAAHPDARQRQGVRPFQDGRRGHRHQRLFRRPLCRLAARRQREQQRLAPPIPAQGHRYEQDLRRNACQRNRSDQQSAKKMPRLQNTKRDPASQNRWRTWMLSLGNGVLIWL